MVRFFIDRPIFAAVISILITLAGLFARPRLPISQFPAVTPPTIQVDCAYPGADADVVSKTIAAPIEQRVNGAERMLYMSSQCTSEGSYTLTVTFEPGTDLDQAQVDVQNRVSLAIADLPEQVRATGVTARKRSPEILLTVSLNSPGGERDQLYLSNYAVIHLKDVLSRIDGISDVLVFGQRDYSMRIWIDPDALDTRNLTVLDVIRALRSQNAEVALGQLGHPGNTNTQLSISTLGRLKSPEQFQELVIGHGTDGELVRLRDVAEVRFGARSEDISNVFDGKATVGLAIFMLPDANSLNTAEHVKKAMDELARDFPPGVTAEIGYDTTPFISASIEEVYKALFDSILLVAIVVLVFLQNWRSALIPLATVPVAIIGTFAAMNMVGFGLNNLTLFGLVLAVGIVVDDSIVVVEAVQQQIEQGFPPREATLRAMSEVSGAVIAVGLVLSAVFVPCAFFPGIVGQFFRQFALTIAISTLISTFNSLTLSPALAALLLRPKDARPDVVTRLLNMILGIPFRIFNWTFDRLGRGYTGIVGRLIRVPLFVCIVYAGLLGFTGWWYQGAPSPPAGRWQTPSFTNPISGQPVRSYAFSELADGLRLPNGFIPQQDKGYLIASVQLPDASSVARTREVITKISRIAMETKGVQHVNAVAGNSFVLSSYGSNFGSMFIILDDFRERLDPSMHADAIADRLRKRMAKEVPGANIVVFGAPAVPGLGRAGGLKLMIQDRGDVGPRRLEGLTSSIVEKGNRQPVVSGLFTAFRTSGPQIRVNINYAACSAAGVEPRDVTDTMQATLGSRYVNDFNLFGRTWQVNVQALPRFRDRIDDVRRVKVRNRDGGLVPIGSLATVRLIAAPLVISRYNMYPTAAVQGNIAMGGSSGEAIAVLQQIANDTLPNNMGSEWTELTFIELRSRDTGFYVFLLSVLVVFLVLAALYESWTLPLAVILVVPLCVLSSLIGVWSAGQELNLFTQVGFVVLIGLACKNAILIVEYAKHQRTTGAKCWQAVLAACRLRLRPILMTSLAFIFGVLPLTVADGAGAEMRRSLGTAVFAGMLGVTLFGLFLTPVFFVVVDRFSEGRLASSAAAKWLSRIGLAIMTFRWIRPVLGRAVAGISRWQRRHDTPSTPDRPS